LRLCRNAARLLRLLGIELILPRPLRKLLQRAE
jgi:hypothetical protein